MTRSKGKLTTKSKQEGNAKQSKKSDKRKLVLNRDEPEDLDDSFETAMKTSREVAGAEPKWKKSKCLNKREDYESIYIRNPPLELISIMKDFTVEQQKSVKKMGFGSILATTVGNTPNKLGYWLAENYDPDSNTLQIGNKSLLITRQTVKDVYGFPMGNTPINTFERASSDNIVLQEFKNQYSTKDGRVRMSDVLPELVKDVTGGRKFILNFLVSVMTTFVGGNTYGAVNQKFLPDIQADTDIMDLDWCTYALECLNSGRKSWDCTKRYTYFTGPLLLLVVLYVSSTICPGEIIERRLPLMNCWTTQMLKKREAKEVKDGGFGKLKIADGAVLVDNDVDDEVLIHTVEEVLESEDMARCSDDNEALEFIPESTLSQYSPEQPIDSSKNKSKNIIVAKSLHPTDFYGYTIRERFAKMGWEQLLDFDCDKIYRRIVIDWTSSLSRNGDELTGIVDGKPYTISPTIIRALLRVDTRTDLPYARFSQADFQTITDENEIRWLEACKTVFGRELDKNVVFSYLEMTTLVKILWEIGLWTFHPRLNDTNCVLAREIYLLHALYTGEYLYSFAHLMIDDIWSMYEDEYQKAIPHVYYLSEILTRLGAVSQDELIEVVDMSHRQITRNSFTDLHFSESPTRYIIYDRVLKQQVTFLKKAIEVEAPPQSPPHLMSIPNPHADKTNNAKDLISTQLSQSQKQLDDMMSIVSNMQKHMEQQACEAKHRDQERELLEQERENRAQEREKQAKEREKWSEEREKRAEIQVHTMTNNLQNLMNKRSEEQHEKMIMIGKNMQKQMGDQASKAERRELAREKWEEEREKQAEIKAHAMESNLQNLISKQFQEHYEKMTMIVNDMQKQMECQALKAECREERKKQEQEREKQAQIKAQAMANNLQNRISKQFQEQCEKMTMIVNDKLKQMECEALKAKHQEEERERQEQEREKQAQIKALTMANNLQNMISMQLQEQCEKMTMIVNDKLKQMECEALKAKHQEEEREKQEHEREKQAEIKALAMANNLQNMISKQLQEQNEKMLMIVSDKLKQMECEALKAKHLEEEREKQEQEREKQAQIKAQAMANNLQNRISKQFQEQCEKMTMIVNDKLKQMECEALKAKHQEEERERQEQEREKQAQIKALTMANNLQNMISMQLQEQNDKMIMIVNDKLKQMECQALKAKHLEEEREKQEQEREKQAEIKAHTIANNLQNMISKQLQEQNEKMIMIVNDKLKQMECQALKAEHLEEEREKQEQEREKQAEIKAHTMAYNLQNMISKQLQERHEKTIMIVNNMQKQKDKQEEEREKRADIRTHAIIWDIERQRYLYEQEQRQLRMAWNQGNCVNGMDEFQFPQISHTSFHPPRVGSLYYDATQSNEIPHAFRSLYHNIYGPRD